MAFGKVVSAGRASLQIFPKEAFGLTNWIGGIPLQILTTINRSSACKCRSVGVTWYVSLSALLQGALTAFPP